jgi:hypothetical protein
MVRELPVDVLGSIPFAFTDHEFVRKRGDVVDSEFQALPGHGAQFDLRDIQVSAVRGV